MKFNVYAQYEIRIAHDLSGVSIDHPFLASIRWKRPLVELAVKEDTCGHKNGVWYEAMRMK
jgi:hypothetical protein